ncbi:MAG: PAS domain-containing protein, partial [Candidatus Methylumidiphilus sp.]
MIEATLCLALDAGLTPLLVDDGIEALLGFSAAEFLAGRVKLAERIHADDQDIADLLFERECERDGSPRSGSCNLRLRQANGRIRCVRGEFTRKPGVDRHGTLELRLQDAKGLPRTLEDASLTASFRAMMDNSDDFIFFKDRNHVFTAASQTCVSICSPAEHWSDLLGLT